MEKKYQVFVSSTYKDLLEERQEVMQALLELDCIPVGMELFPAADDDQWTLIKKLIEDCDYYVLIVGGRYGSVSSEGISFTQMEYEYSLKKSIPIISFLHKSPDQISVAKSDTDPDLKKKLESFKDLVQQKMCKYYNSPAELGSLVSRSLVNLIKTKPRPGWIKSTFLPSEEDTLEILRLRRKIDDLNKELAESRFGAENELRAYSQGDDPHIFKITYMLQSNEHPLAKRRNDEISLTWNEIFAVISPVMTGQGSEYSIHGLLNKYVENNSIKRLASQLENEDSTIYGIQLADFEVLTIKIQLIALSLITVKNEVRDKSSITLWRLTPLGERLMAKLKAIKKASHGLSETGVQNM